MSATIDVLLAVRNGRAYLEPQIDSVLSQSWRELRLIVLDDASTDGCAELVERLARRDPRVSLVRRPQNLGAVGNFLEGLKLTAGNYTAFCDQDDIWLPDKLETLKALLCQNPSNRLAYSDLEVCDADLRTLERSFWRSAGIRPRAGLLGERALLRNLAPGCSMLMHPEVSKTLASIISRSTFAELNRAERLDETPFMHDHLAFAAASGLGRLCYTPRPLVRYRQHSRNSIGAFYGASRDRARMIDCLRRRIAILRLDGDFAHFDLKRLERYADALDRQGSGGLAYLDFERFRRKDGPRDQLLAWAQAMAPGMYERMRKGAQVG